MKYFLSYEVGTDLNAALSSKSAAFSTFAEYVRFRDQLKRKYFVVYWQLTGADRDSGWHCDYCTY